MRKLKDHSCDKAARHAVHVLKMATVHNSSSVTFRSVHDGQRVEYAKHKIALKSWDTVTGLGLQASGLQHGRCPFEGKCA